MTSGGNYFNGFLEIVPTREITTKTEKTFLFSCPWQWACFLNGPNAAASTAPTVICTVWVPSGQIALTERRRGYFSVLGTVGKVKGSPYSITERRVLELIPVLGSQPAGDVTHKPSSRLPLLFARPAVTLATLEAYYQFCCLVNRGTMGVNSLPETVTRQCRGCDLNPGPSLPESSTLTTRLLSHPQHSGQQQYR